jgi:sugar lactone lactonase YvrE
MLLGTAAAGGLVALIACGDTSAPPEKSDGIIKITAVEAATGLESPIDATPDPMGREIYFIAREKSGTGVFHVSANGGAFTQVYVGAPFVDPHGISISSDGKTLYVADRTAGKNGGGAIFAMPTWGDTPAAVAGSEGTHPGALDLAERGSSDDIYFTGAASNGDPAVFKLGAEGGAAQVLASGAPFAKPDGITVGTDLTIYVADAQAGEVETGQVFKLAAGAVTRLGGEFSPGDTGGIAVMLASERLLVSSLDPSAGTSQAAILSTRFGTGTTFTDVIKENEVSRGIHRARFKDVYTFTGHHAVYRLRMKPIGGDSSTPGGVGHP